MFEQSAQQFRRRAGRWVRPTASVAPTGHRSDVHAVWAPSETETLEAMAQLAGRLVCCDGWLQANRWTAAAMSFLVPGIETSVVAWDARAVVPALPSERSVVPIVCDGRAVGALCHSGGDEARAPKLARAVARLLGRFSAAQRLRDELRERCERDHLTGLFNRRHFSERIESELERARRKGESVGLMMIDVDRFKQFNSQLGYAVGDAVLQRIARLISDSVRSSDVVCRLGGDELAVVMSNTAADTALRRARSLVERVGAASHVDHSEQWPAVTVSAGVALAPIHATTSDDLLVCADIALRAGKRAGGQAVGVYDHHEPVVYSATSAPVAPASNESTPIPDLGWQRSR